MNILKSKAHSIIRDTEVVVQIREELEQHGFKYLKSKGHFFKEDGAFKCILPIGIEQLYTFINVDNDDLFVFSVDIYPIIEYKELNSFLKKYGTYEEGQKNLGKFQYFISKKVDSFTYDQFMFGDGFYGRKTFIKKDAIGPILNKEGVEISHLSAFANQIESVLSLFPKFQNYSEIQSKFNDENSKRAYLIKYFIGKKEEAKQGLLALYQTNLIHFEEENEEQSKNNQRAELVEMAIMFEELFNEALGTPEPLIDVVVNTANERYFAITTTHHYKEVLAVKNPTGSFKKVVANAKGCLVALNKQNELEFFDESGQKTKNIALKKNKHFIGFDEYNMELKALPNSKLINIKNLVLLENGEELYLKLPDELPPDFVSLVLLDCRFNAQNEQIQLLVKSKKRKNDNVFVLSYNLHGKIVSATTIPLTNYLAAYDAQWKYFVCHTDKIIQIWNSDGKQIDTRKVPYGLNQISVSSSAEPNLICCANRMRNYAIFLNPKLAKHKILRGHPANDVEYYETLYFDEQQYDSYDRDPAISPDGTYGIVRSSFGKEVVFQLPSGKRIELVPNVHYMHKYDDPIESSVSPKKSYLAKYKDNEYFVRYNEAAMKFGYDEDGVVFIDNGDYFLLNHGNETSVWNRKLENINFVNLKLTNAVIQKTHVFVKNENEYVFYKRMEVADKSRDTVKEYQRPRAIVKEPVTLKPEVERLMSSIMSTTQVELDIENAPEQTENQKDTSKDVYSENAKKEMPKLSFWQKILGKR